MLAKPWISSKTLCMAADSTTSNNPDLAQPAELLRFLYALHSMEPMVTTETGLFIERVIFRSISSWPISE